MNALSAFSASTQGVPTTNPQFQVNNLTSNPAGFFDNFGTMITNIMNIVLVIGVIAVLLYLIWGGLEWITSGGDKGKTESARNKITAAVIGLIIVISAWAIMMFVQQLLGLQVFGGTT